METEKEKMLSGEFCDPSDPELVRDRVRARRLTRLFNQTLENEVGERAELRSFHREEIIIGGYVNLL